MAGPLIDRVWITVNHNMFAAAWLAELPIGSSEAPSAKEFLKAFKAGIELDWDDAKAAGRAARGESGDEGPKGWSPQWTARNKKRHLQRLTRREKETFRKIKADYAAVHGKPILVSELSGYRDDSSLDFNLHPPALVRVTDTPEQDLFRFGGEGWVDPYWNLELIQPHDGLYKVRSLWMFGTSYNLKTGETSPARFRFPDEP